MRFRLALFAAVALFAITSAQADAKPGAPLTAFGKAGRVLSGNGVATAGVDYANTRVLADGSIVALTDIGRRNALVKLTPAGAADQSFGNDGTVFLDGFRGPDPFSWFSLETDSQGRIVLAGGTTPRSGSVIERRLSDGSLDQSFASDGVLELKTRNTDHLAIDAADRILVAGYGAPTVRRYTVAGSPDPTFGENGRATIHLDRRDDQIYRLIATPDGIFLGCRYSTAKLDLNGSSQPSFDQNSDLEPEGGRPYLATADGKLLVGSGASVIRLLPDGHRDPTFGSTADGSVDTGGGVRSFIERADGSIVVTVGRPDPQVDGLIRLAPDGSRDLNFGKSGGFLPFPRSNGVTYLVDNGAQSDLLLGVQESRESRIRKLTEAGDPVLDFGQAGTAEVGAIVPTNDDLTDMGRRADGSLLTIGATGRTALLQSFGADGKLEADFGLNGRLRLPALDRHPGAPDPRLVMLPHGGAIVCATSEGEPALWRISRTGKIDDQFGEDGGGSGLLLSGSRCLDLAFDGSGVMVALYMDGYGLIIVRVNPVGFIESTYGNQGRAIPPFQSWPRMTYGNQVRMATDSRGRTTVATLGSGMSVARFRPDGHPDRSFGRRGVVEFTIREKSKRRTSLAFTNLSSMSLNKRGIVIGGSWDGRAAVARLNDRGFPLRGFGKDGVVTLPHPGGAFRGTDVVLGVAQQSDGKILATGRRNLPCRLALSRCPQPMFVYRLAPGGRLDQPFSTRAQKAVKTIGRGIGKVVLPSPTSVTVGGTVDTNAGRNEFGLFELGR